MAVTDKQLHARARQLAKRIATTRAALDELASERDRLIVELSARGVTRRQVADLTGVTQGRVQQILDRARGAA